MSFGAGRRISPRRQQGSETAPGQKESGQPGGSNNSILNKMIESGRSRLGDVYGTGQHKYGKPGTGVSCSGLIYSMRQDAGLGNPYWGTYGYMDHYTARPGPGMGTWGTYQPGKKYPAGYLFVSTGGAGGPDGTHVAMSIGNGKVIESVNGTINKVRIADAPGGFMSKSGISLAVMPDVGTSDQTFLQEAVQNPGEAVGGAVSGAVGAAAGDIADGIAAGLLRVVKYIYGKMILQPMDFFSGFWWEFLKHFTGQFVPKAADETDQQQDEVNI